MNNFTIISGKQLDSNLQAIGFNIFCNKKSKDLDIEETIISASIEAINGKDNRLGGLLVDWVTIHSARINVDKLTKFVRQLDHDQYKFVRVFWSANAQRLALKDQRFKRLSQIYKGKRINLADYLTQKKIRPTNLLITLKGCDERFENTCIRLPKGYFSERSKQILPSSVVAKNHLTYRYRLMMGPSYRADVWAIIKRHPKISAYALAKKAYCSYRTAYVAKKDYETLHTLSTAYKRVK